MEVVLTVDRRGVYDEVAKTTEYTGAKMDDELAYETVSTTEEDEVMLERFWDECKSALCNSLKRMLVKEEETKNGVYELTLELSSAFNNALTQSMQRSLFSFFVMNITAKWYAFTNKGEATGYATQAATCIEDIMRKALFKRKPERPVFD